MVKKPAKKQPKKVSKKVVEETEEHEGGASLDDAFGDDEDVEYAPTKVKKKKKIDEEEEELEEELDEIQSAVNGHEERGEIDIKSSKPITKVKKGDRVIIDGITYEVDAHDVLIDHGSTKEMAIEIFNPKTDRDYQLRYFDDQIETTLDLYELQEIIYVKRSFKKVEW
jgi:hypothetical protein